MVYSGMNDLPLRVRDHKRTHWHNLIVLHRLDCQMVGPYEAEADHPYSQLFYVRRGALTVHCDGGRHEFASCQACLIQPLEKYRVSALADKSCRVLNIGFAFGLSPARSMKDNSPWQRLDNIESIQDLASGFDRVTAALAAADRADVAQIRRFVIGVLARIIDGLTLASFASTRIDQTGNLVDQMRQLLAQNANRSYGIKELVHLLNRCDRHLSRVFKHATGMTIKAYHDRLRMNIAADLIATTNLHVTDISNELGFDSIHSFSRRFKTVFTHSPIWFRQEAALDETVPS